jgi:hypothetical protein
MKLRTSASRRWKASTSLAISGGSSLRGGVWVAICKWRGGRERGRAARAREGVSRDFVFLATSALQSPSPLVPPRPLPRLSRELRDLLLLGNVLSPAPALALTPGRGRGSRVGGWGPSSPLRIHRCCGRPSHPPHRGVQLVQREWRECALVSSRMGLVSIRMCAPSSSSRGNRGLSPCRSPNVSCGCSLSRNLLSRTAVRPPGPKNCACAHCLCCASSSMRPFCPVVGAAAGDKRGGCSREGPHRLPSPPLPPSPSPPLTRP